MKKNMNKIRFVNKILSDNFETVIRESKHIKYMYDTFYMYI